MTEFELFEGYLWPKADVHCRAVILEQSGAIPRLVKLCPKLRVAVQAGGNCGVWPKLLAQSFERVYTFEPDPYNYHCLVHNCTEPNITHFNAAVGSCGEPPVSMVTEADNCGSGFVGGPGTIPVMAIDNLGLEHCDLIALDIEGYEPRALLGGRETIRRCRPIILIENKGLSERVGLDALQVEANVLIDGYRIWARHGRDTIFTPT